MDNIRIAILSANNTPVAFMDNQHKKSMHYWKDELHEYLQGAANTYTFTVSAKHQDAENVTAGNKVAFIHKGKSYYLNIVNTEQTEETITATAWSLSFELINEDAGEYKAGKAMSFEEYLAIFDAERTLKLGLNEVSDKRITNEWTGTTSVLKRLFSLANVFSAEIEFETVLNSDYSLKEIVLNVYRKHSDTDSGVGEYRNDIVLRYGKGITGIRKTTDAEKLYTCIQPTGKDGLTINGLDKKEYDENGNIEYFTDGAIIRAPQARDRFPSNIVNKEDAYILMRKEYDTDSKDKLYSMALSDLKTASEPVVTYEVDGYFDTNIGDTVRMQDQEWTPVLYLQARVSEQIRSLTNPKTAKTVFTNYKELTSEISDSLLQRMQDLINKNKVYTCSISTNNGIIFKNGIGSTTLTAYAYDNGVDVADKLQFRWSKDGTEFYVGKSVTVNAEDVDVKAVYSFTAFESGVKRGYYEVTITDVMDGEDGQDGTTYYTWFKFADDEYGNGMSSSPDGKEYLGIAYNKVTPVMSNNPEDYQWARITGEGVPGKPGDDGKTYYTWVRYADDASGNGMSDSPNGKYYIGFAYNKEVPTESSNPTDYQWSKYKGDDGQDGVGIKSITKYYLASEKSTGITISSSGWSTTKQDMTDVKKYLWSYEVYAYTNGTSTKTTPIIIGVHGQNGGDGDSGIIVSPTAPENPKAGQLWQTASGEPIKRWDGSKWVIYYISVENLNVETLSAIAADLGTVTAGLIKDKNGTMLIDVTSGKIISKKIVQGAVENVASLSNAYLDFSGKAPTTDRATMSVNLQNIMFTNENTRKATTIQFEDEMIYARNSVSPRISIYAYRNYDSGTVKGPYTSTNSANNIRVELKRRGFMVTCKITMLAQFPSSGGFGAFDEVGIPVGYRPVFDIYAPYSEVSGSSIFGTGRYIIGKDGGITIYVNNPNWTERLATLTWITDNN
ncbi:tail fiber protein [Ruminococcus phage phiRg519T2]|uniref:Tail fiber protein n=1 Tax=Ruminococcus phage phiRg519T2 TaxID=2772519 RepID=A0AAE7T2C3_9CAUD|nr:tail fiber protein [Ruminococcus phage phiRg519T2]